jgi:hypothetical protein
MPTPTYYLVNRTRKEFYSFDNDVPIFKVLENVLQINSNWKNTDNIRVETDDSQFCSLLEYLLNDLKFTNCDFSNNND